MSLDDRFVDLVAGGFDLAIRIGALPDSSLVARRIAETRMMACASPAYLDAHGRPGSVAALGRLDRLAFSGARSAGDWRFVDAAGRAETADGTVRLLSDDLAVLVAAAVAGAGVVFGPCFALEAAVQRGALERVLPGHGTDSLGVHAVFPSARLVGPEVRRFVDALAVWFKARPGWVEPGGAV